MTIYIIFVKICATSNPFDIFWKVTVDTINLPSTLLQRFFDQAFNQGDLSIVDDLFSIDSTTHTDRWGIPSDRSGLKLFIATLRSGFPDLHCTIEHEIGTGDWLAAHWTMRGTHRGPFLGNAPSDRTVEIPGMIFARLENDRIAEDWTLIDLMGILRQLGVVPPVSRKER